MSKTRFMTVLFSASENGDEELTSQIAEDIQLAKENGSYEDENGEMSYKDLGDKGVLATDKGNGEHTLIHENPIRVGDDIVIDLEEIPDYCVEDLVHPEVSENEGSMVYNPMNEKEFSVSTDNSAVLKIFSDQDLVETVTESVYKSEQDAQVGDLKFEKDSDSDGVIVTDLTSGDKAKVELEGEDMKVTELDQKNFKYFSSKKDMNVIRRKVFSHAEQYEPIFVVAIDPINKVLVNSPVYGEEAANDLAQKLMERGLMGVNVFANPDEGREYAMSLLCGEGATEVGDEEEMEVAYSDNKVIANRYFSDRTRFMNRLFSEAEDEVTDHQDLIESAIADGEQTETEDFIITPVDDSTAVVEDKDNGEYTVAELDGEDINVEELSEDEAADMMKNIEVEDGEQKEYSSDKIGLIQKGANWISKKGQSLKNWGDKMRDKNVMAPIKDKLGNQIGMENKLTKKGELIKAAGEFIEKNPKKAAAIAATTLATAGTGAGVGISKAVKKKNSEKEYSDVDEATLAQIEDSSVEAIQNVQDAAETAIQAINEAKEAPVEEVKDIKEATYSETQKSFSESLEGSYNPTLEEVW